MKKDIYFIDFETFSRQEIKFGSFRYAMDESTEVICLAYSLNGEEPELWYPGLKNPIKLLNHIKRDGLIRSFNATFEYGILNYTCARLYKWPKVKPKQMRDTMSDSLALSLPGSLAGCAEALGITQQKDKRGRQLITLLSKPRKPTKKKPYDRNTKDLEPELFEEMYSYCLQDVRTEIGIFNALPRFVKGNEQRIFEQTLEINQRGVPVDIALVDSILEAKEIYQIRLNKEIEKITNGELISTGSRPKALAWLLEQGVTMDGYTKGDVQAALKRTISKEARRFLEIRSELSRTPIKKFDFLKNAICPDGTIKNNLIYHKATTGRYAGSGFQIHNLPRDSSENPEKLISQFLDKKDLASMNVYNEAIKLVRTAITAKKGYKLIVSDFSSIENRVIAWLAGDYETLQDFVLGVDQYKTVASSIYSVPYDSVSKDQRQLGKISVLSCCFGGGWKTFREICRTQWGINISEEESQDIVDGYRKKYYKIVKFWYGLYSAAMTAVTANGNMTKFKAIQFRKMGDFLYMRLPSGRLLSYYKPELRKVMTPWGQEKLALTHMGTNTYTRKWERLTVIPGRLTENVVQATARDFLTESMKNVETEKYTIVGCVHDEIISEVSEDFGSIEEFNKLMEVLPSWAKDFPLAAEGYEAKRYKK